MSDYIKQLCDWQDDGTLERIDEARRQRRPVRIRRSSGALQDAIILCCGHGGFTSVVAWHEEDLNLTKFEIRPGAGFVDPAPGTLLKLVDTADIIALNPWMLGG